jgi:DNA-binding CsgD family transcriptional regulator
MLAADASGHRLEEEMLSFGRQLGPLVASQRKSVEQCLSVAMIRELRSVQAKYRMAGALVGEGVLGSEPLVLLTLERMQVELPGEAALRERFGLSRREAGVALLLARRASNSEIARELFISPHTARHHTEQVLLKLGVHSRFAVSTRILAESGPDQPVAAAFPAAP